MEGWDLGVEEGKEEDRDRGKDPVSVFISVDRYVELLMWPLV